MYERVPCAYFLTQSALVLNRSQIIDKRIFRSGRLANFFRPANQPYSHNSVRQRFELSQKKPKPLLVWGVAHSTDKSQPITRRFPIKNGRNDGPGNGRNRFRAKPATNLCLKRSQAKNMVECRQFHSL